MSRNSKNPYAMSDQKNDQVAGRRIGELNGPWAGLLKFTLALMPFIISWGAFMTVKIYSLDTKTEVISEVAKQISINTATIGRHEKDLAAAQGSIAAVAKELMPMGERIKVFVTRAEWDLKSKSQTDERAVDRENLHRELGEMKEALKAQGMKIDILLARGTPIP